MENRGGKPIVEAVFCMTQGVTQPPLRHAQNIHFFLPCWLLPAFCMRIAGVSCKHKFITFMNHYWIAWSTWGNFPNHQFDTVSMLNTNVWHAGGNVAPVHLEVLQNISFLQQNVWAVPVLLKILGDCSIFRGITQEITGVLGFAKHDQGKIQGQKLMYDSGALYKDIPLMYAVGGSK